MSRFGRDFRGISPVLAVLMMIAVAIAGALFTYAWVMGYIGFQTEKSGEAIQIQSVSDDGVDLRVYVQNVGETVMQLEEDGCLYVDGRLVPCSIYSVSVLDDTASLDQGETATVRYSGGAPPQGETVTVKVVTVHGTYTEEVYLAGSGDGGSVSVMWNHIYGGPRGDRVCSVVETSDGGYALLGGTGFGNADIDFWLVKVDADGNELWNQTYGGTGSDKPCSLVATSDGGYVLAGSTHSFSAGGSDVWLIKTDAEGVMEWNKTYGGASDEVATCLIVTPDGGYAIAGMTRVSFENYAENYLLITTDASGNMKWNGTYGGKNTDCACSLVATSDGGYAIAGWTTISYTDCDDDFWLVKVDEDGVEEWNRTYGGQSADQACSLVATLDGGYAIAGFTFADNDCDFWLVKTDASGEELWTKNYGETDTHDEAYSLVATSDGGYVIAGATKHSFISKYWVIKTDNRGNIAWDKTYGETEFYTASSVVETSDGEYTIACVIGRIFEEDVWLIKTDEYGNTR